MPLLTRLALIAALAIPVAPAFPALAHGPQSTVEQGEIIHLMMAQFDRPEAPLTVAPVVVQGDSAIAGWSQDGLGGRALLRRGPQGWAIVLCAGPEVLDPQFLAHHGLAPSDAQSLTLTARSAEEGLGAALIARLDSFDGVLLIEAGDAQTHGHAPAGH